MVTSTFKHSREPRIRTNTKSSGHPPGRQTTRRHPAAPSVVWYQPSTSALGDCSIAHDPSSSLIATKSFEVADRNRTGVLVHGVESQIPISQLFHKTWPLTHPACVTISPSRCDNDNCQQEPVGQRRLHNPYNGKPDLNPDCRQRAFEGEGGKGILARHV